MEAQVDDIELVLVPGPAQTALIDGLAQDLAGALAIDADTVEVSNIREAVGEATGRRVQSASQVAFDLLMSGPSAADALQSLTEQLHDPNSDLRQSPTAGRIDPTIAPTFAFVCPVGMIRQLGDAECTMCGADEVPADDFSSCKECVPGETPDETGARCVCDGGYYNATRGFIKCFADGEAWSEMPGASEECLLCGSTGCSDQQISCEAGLVRLLPDFAVSQTSIDQGVPFDEMNGLRAVFACDGDAVCLGDTESMSWCAEGRAGPLCQSCDAGWSRPGFSGECTLCAETLSALWTVGAGVVAVVMVTGLLYWVSAEHAETAKMGMIVTLGKIAVSLIQVLTQLEFCLDLQWPEMFRHFVAFLKLFSFDLLAFIDVGCVME